MLARFRGVKIRWIGHPALGEWHAVITVNTVSYRNYLAGVESDEDGNVQSGTRIEMSFLISILPVISSYLG
jgi:hypothetical protein